MAFAVDFSYRIAIGPPKNIGRVLAASSSGTLQAEQGITAATGAITGPKPARMFFANPTRTLAEHAFDQRQLAVTASGLIFSSVAISSGLTSPRESSATQRSVSIAQPSGIAPLRHQGGDQCPRHRYPDGRDRAGQHDGLRYRAEASAEAWVE
jgi:hypothetical protein